MKYILMTAWAVWASYNQIRPMISTLILSSNVRHVAMFCSPNISVRTKIYGFIQTWPLYCFKVQLLRDLYAYVGEIMYKTIIIRIKYGIRQQSQHSPASTWLHRLPCPWSNPRRATLVKSGCRSSDMPLYLRMPNILYWNVLYPFIHFQ